MLAVPIDAARPDAISVPRKHEFQIWEPCLEVTFEALDNTARLWQEAAHHAPMVPGAGVVVRRSGTARLCRGRLVGFVDVFPSLTRKSVPKQAAATPR